MEVFRLTKDINVIYIEAESFPGGVKNAFTKLYSQVAGTQQRRIFGLSKLQHGIIIYKAAASENFEGEGASLQLPTFLIRKGVYLTETLMDWQQNEMMIGSIFNRLVADKRLDGSAHCIEWYKSERELWCMVLMQEPEADSTIKELHI